MKFLLLNQTFYPDVASTAQHLSDLATALVQRGHAVTVVTARRSYVNPQTSFAPKETWNGVEIHRVPSTGSGKKAKWRRALNFGSFTFSCCVKLVALPRHDVVVALTTPPLISFIGGYWARLRRARFVYWVMDFNPDEAIAADWLRPNSMTARALERMSRFSLDQAHSIFALDHFMKARIAAKGISESKVSVVQPWAHDEAVRFDPIGRKQFRKAHGLEKKFVVMYSGNHSPIHPLDTLLQAAERLRAHPDIAFCFVGGGGDFERIRKWAEGRANVLCLPYQPLNHLAASLSAADLHVITMGDPFVGLVHPCKIYNILSVAAPVLYIGPQPSHVTEILDRLGHTSAWASCRHGEAERVAKEIVRLMKLSQHETRREPDELALTFSKSVLVPRMIAELERQ